MIITKKIPEGTSVTWEASATSYFPQHGSFIMPNAIKELNINLEYDRWSEYWVACNDIRDGYPSSSNDKVAAGFTNYVKYAAPVLKSDHSSPMDYFRATNSELRYVQYIDYSTSSSISITGCANLEYIYNITPRDRSEGLCSFDFSDNVKLGTITSFDASRAKTVSFKGCSQLRDIDIVNMQNVIGGSEFYDDGMFEGCTSLQRIPEAISEAPLKDCSNMFMNCSSITYMPPLNTSNCRDFERMFMGCTGLTSIPQLDGSRLSMKQSASTSGRYFGLEGCFAGFTGVFGGFRDLGKRITAENISSEFKNIVINIGGSSPYNWIGDLNAQSTINILNNLYDVSGVSGRKTNISISNKIWGEIPEEVIASAASKGWYIYNVE